MKSTISLDARIFDSGHFNNPPVAPPRRKKGTTLKKGSTLPATFSNNGVRNGFKEVFGNASASSSNYDDIEFIDKDENSLHERATSTPEKKLRIGNKKSDKFFGESLSDRISDEPISPISKTVDESIESKSQNDKKLSFFLMNMLDDIRDATDAERYRNQQPVEEPLFVAKKREIKHICDDDDHMHAHAQGHKYDSDQNIAPPKPDRDFTKFKAAENVIEIKTISAEKYPEVDAAAQTKVVVKRGVSRDNLPLPPATPQRKSGVVSPPSTPTITIETIELHKSPAQNKHETTAEKEQTTPKITEMMDEMIKRAYGMSNYSPEDHTHHTHDELFEPTSKLAVRKISTPRKISTASTPDAESVNKTFELPLPASPFKKTSFCEDAAQLDQLLKESHKFYEIDEAARIPKSPATHEKLERGEVGIGCTMNDIIDEIYSKNSEVMQDFQAFLEQSLEKEPVINVDEEKKFVESKKTLGENEEEEYPPKDIEDGLDTCSYSDSFESSDAEQDVLTKASNEITNNHLKRRESIEDVDNWFSHHAENEETESDICSNARNDPPPGYDTHKIFPFGSTITGRRDSMSDEFFTEPHNLLRIMPHIATLRESESSISEDGEVKDVENKNASRESSVSKESNKSKSPDHSTLLKYFDHSITITDEKDEDKKQQ
jgi:hypothetical protein